MFRLIATDGERVSRPSRAGILTAAVALLVGLLVPLGAAAPAFADANADDFDPGLIISDDVMFYPDSMTKADIQEFLDDNAGKCRSGYTCLVDYKATTSDREKTPMCDAFKGSGSTKVSSAEIIYSVAQACDVNPQVLLVMLQKEQGLITDTWPTPTQYKIAMGYGCPDTAPCDKEYYGFFNQVFRAAYALVRYTMPKGTGAGTEYYTNYNWFPVGKKTKIQYHPNASCNTKTVTIENKATASLYYYTPYVPNGAALDNLYGTGDKCSSYGNRNFWRMFTDWFGSTVIKEKAGNITTAYYEKLLDREPTSDEAYADGFRISGGTSRTTVLSDIMSSTEYRTIVIKDAYQHVLQRSPSSAEITKWLGWLKSGKVKLSTLTPKLYDDPSFYKRLGGGTDEGFTKAAFESIFGYTPSGGQLASWTTKVQAKGKGVIAAQMWNGLTHRKMMAAEINTPLWGYRSTSDAVQTTGAARIAKVGYYSYLKELLASNRYYTRNS